MNVLDEAQTSSYSFEDRFHCLEEAMNARGIWLFAALYLFANSLSGNSVLAQSGAKSADFDVNPIGNGLSFYRVHSS